MSLGISDKVLTALESPLASAASSVNNANTAVGDLQTLWCDNIVNNFVDQAASETAGLDSFTSGAESNKTDAQQVDASYDANQDAQMQNQASYEQVSTELESCNNNISSYTSIISQMKTIQNSKSDSDSEDTVDYTEQIAIYEGLLAEEEEKRTQLEAEKTKLEMEAQTLQSEEAQIIQTGNEVEAQAQNTASNAQSTANQADATASDAQDYKAQAQEKAEAQKQAQEAKSIQPASTQETAAASYAYEEYYTQEDDAADSSLASSISGTSEKTEKSLREKIDNNEKVDSIEMASLIINDYDASDIDLTVAVSETDLIGLDAEEAGEIVAEAVETQVYSDTVYTSKVSVNTDSATIEEHKEASANFYESYTQARETVDVPDVEFLSVSDETNYELIEAIAARVDKGEYVQTRELEKAADKAVSIQVQAAETNEEETSQAQFNGERLLARLQGVITDDKDAPEDETDDILTEKEYNDIMNFFESSEDIIGDYSELVLKAEQYGIFAQAA